MIVWQHDRTHDHTGTEDCSSVWILEPIGRYPAYSFLCDILDDMFSRLVLIDADYVHGFSVASIDALIAPYAPNGALMGVFGVDSWIKTTGTSSFGLDAELVSPTTAEISGSFGIGSVLVELHNDAITVLTADVDPGDTVIHVDNSAGFPSVPFLIQIGGEVMTVISVSGNDWTVVRDNPVFHPLGSYVVVC